MKNRLIALVATGLLAACSGGSNTTDNTATGAADAQAKALQRSTKTAATTTYQNTVQSLYVAYFGRPADPVGLANFAATLQADGAPTDVSSLATAYSTNASIKTLIDSFGNSKESQTLYGSGNATAFVTAVFQNVLGRAPASAGLSFWVNAINAGSVTQGQAALAIMGGALTNTSTQGKLDTQLIGARLTYASYFTSQVTIQNATSAYSGAAAAAVGRTMLSGVTATSSTVSYPTGVVETVEGLMTQGGNQANLSIGGPASVYSGTNFLTLNGNTNGSVVIDSLGNRYAIDATSYSVIYLGSNNSNFYLDGLTVDGTTGYLLSNGYIVGYLGYGLSNGVQVAAFYSTANGATGYGQIGVSNGKWTFTCGSGCASNTPNNTPNALQITDTTVGTGAVATLGKTATVSYTGWLYSPTATNNEGTQFDSSASHNTTFPFVVGAGSVIEGWDQGVLGMKVGGTRTLIVPSVLGYGANANGPIPANSALVFTIQLLSVQ